MITNKQALLAALLLSASSAAFAFQQPRLLRSQQHARQSSSFSRLSAVAVEAEPSSSLIGATAAPTSTPLPKTDDESIPPERTGAMMDLRGIALSGLKGQALSLQNTDFPKANEIRSVIPTDCFEPDTLKSLGYLFVSVAATAACTMVGTALLGALNPANPLTWPLWMAYSAVTGTVAMGLWVLAHECGHGAFSRNRQLQDAIGYIIHSSMLVPYFSWQRSHAVHHQVRAFTREFDSSFFLGFVFALAET